MPQPWRLLMNADDVFVHPANWQMVSRSTAIAVYWRIPVVVVASPGQMSMAGGGEWFDELSPYFSGTSPYSLETLTYYRYVGPAPKIPWTALPGALPPQQSNADQPPVEEQKYWINVTVVDEFGDPVSGLGVTFVAKKQKSGGTTDGNGRSLLNDTGSGKVKVTLGKGLFFTDKSKQGSPIKPPEVKHVMKEKETLSGVAHSFGVHDARTIYYYDANSGLRSKRAALGLVQTKDEMTVPKDFTFEFPAKPDGESHEYKLEVPAMLDITKVDPHFASGKEKLDIAYELQRLAKQKVKIEISSPHLDGGKPLYKRDLEAKEKADGTHAIQWDGLANDGKIKGKHISPLYSPYKVKIFVDGNAKHTDERTFNVLYHSIAFTQGPWTPDGKAPAEGTKDWVVDRLNELGYWGGAVGKDFDDYAKKAIIRYKANHKKMHQALYPSYDDSISADLKKALKAGDNKRPQFPIDAITNPKATSKLLVEEISYEKLTAATNEFGTTQKAVKEKDRLNRPLLPLELEIFLRGKPSGKDDGPKVAAPLGVGPVRIDITYTDAAESTKGQWEKTAAQPSLTKKYLDKCMKLKGGGAGGDNCHKDFGGVREGAATTYKAPFKLGDTYVPHKLEDDSGLKVVYVKACTDEANYRARVGKAGFYFRPSFVGGDTYKLHAAIDFKDLPNKADLEKMHGLDAKKKITDDTGTFRIQRFAKVAMSVDWPARSKAYEWDKIATEFEKAFVDMGTGAVTKKISDVITEAEYKDIVAANTTFVDRTKLSLFDDAMYGLALPAQGAADAATYRATLKTESTTKMYQKIRDPLRDKLSAKIRKDHPTGVIVVNYLAHKPVDIQKAPPGDTKVTKDNKGYVTWAGSIGMSDAIILADQRDPDKVYYVIAHEMGHVFWIEHWQHTNDGGTPTDHDQKDFNCLMSYSSNTCGHAWHAQGVYAPHFCGKCNLQLRGWNVDAAGMPADSG